jgi:hypothetical protein
MSSDRQLSGDLAFAQKAMDCVPPWNFLLPEEGFKCETAGFDFFINKLGHPGCHFQIPQ